MRTRFGIGTGEIKSIKTKEEEVKKNLQIEARMRKQSKEDPKQRKPQERWRGVESRNGEKEGVKSMLARKKKRRRTWI